MTSPVPGLTYPNPREWSKGDLITVPRLRGDMTNMAAIMVSGRPLVEAANTSASQELTANTPSGFPLTFALVNNWNVAGFISAGVNASNWTVPFTGYYLVMAFINNTLSGTTGQQVQMGCGFTVSQNGAGGVSRDGGVVPMIGISDASGGTMGADLYVFNSFTSDTIQWYGYTNANAANNTVGSSMGTAEWVGLPAPGLSLTGYTGPTGTVVSAPTLPATFPPGQGTTITNSGGIAAGATSVTVASATGILTGGTLGLDCINGQYNQDTGEAVSVTNVAGTTISISAASYAHAQGAPVAVPVSAAFLNGYSTDLINFLAYPPLLRASQSSAQSIPSQTFPAATQMTSLTGDTDTFSGLASNTYTVPVSGLYFIYAQVYYAGTTTAFQLGAGIAVNGGTIDWGSVCRADTTANPTPFCVPYCRHVRLVSGDTITFYASQNSGSSMDTVATTQQKSRLVMVFRSF